MSEPNRSNEWRADDAIYSDLGEKESKIISDWFAESSAGDQTGEASVPLISLLRGLILGNRAERIVQLGVSAGYSALLIGFMLRRMNARRGLFAIDLDSELLAVARKWITRAGLGEFVEIAERSSLDPETTQAAKDFLGGDPELIILDTALEYSAALRELHLWYSALAYGGILVVHDVSLFARDLDAINDGGVRRAFIEWRAAHPECESILLNANQRSLDPPRPFYKDACGLGLIHKPRGK